GAAICDVRCCPVRGLGGIGAFSVVLELVCFVSCCCVALLDLLSFPTRRSSDLSRFTEPLGGAACLRLALRRSQVLRGARKTWDRDRKSTRLNSSHVEISYAVFCLKKKTQCRQNRR